MIRWATAILGCRDREISGWNRETVLPLKWLHRVLCLVLRSSTFKSHCKCILECQNIQSHATPLIKGKVRMGFDRSLRDLHGELQCDNGERKRQGILQNVHQPLLSHWTPSSKERFWTYSGHTLVITVIPLATK